MERNSDRVQRQLGPSRSGDPFGEAWFARRARLARPMSSTATGEGEATAGGEPPPPLPLSASVGAVSTRVVEFLLLTIFLLLLLRFRWDRRAPVCGV